MKANIFHRFLLIVLFWAACFSLQLSAQTESKEAVAPFDSPDPTCLEASDGSGFYAFVTGSGIRILHSTNLLDWKQIGRVFSDPVPAWAAEAIPGTRNIWAPDIVRVGGLYYLYYSVSTFGGQRSLIGLAVNKTLNPEDPEYAWQDRGIVLESHPDHTDYNAIDSALFVDEDGKAYLFWGSYWTGLKAVEIDPKTGKPFRYRSGELKIPDGYISVANRGDGRDTSIEAPFVVRNGAWYHLFTSRGSCCDGEKSTYHLAIGRSDKPLGPYVDKEGRRMDQGGGSLLLDSTPRWKGPGHNGVFQTSGNGKNKGDWMILHAYDINRIRRGRLTQVRPMYWDKDGWPTLGAVLTVPLEVFDFSAPPSDPRAE